MVADIPRLHQTAWGRVFVCYRVAWYHFPCSIKNKAGQACVYAHERLDPTTRKKKKKEEEGRYIYKKTHVRNNKAFTSPCLTSQQLHSQPHEMRGKTPQPCPNQENFTTAVTEMTDRETQLLALYNRITVAQLPSAVPGTVSVYSGDDRLPNYL